MSPLPHFLNLPLPQIPSDPSSSKSNNPQPLVFKLNLTAEQYQELLALDAEVEEGEEGGLRVEFDPSGKAVSHLFLLSVVPILNPRSIDQNRASRLFTSILPGHYNSTPLVQALLGQTDPKKSIDIPHLPHLPHLAHLSLVSSGSQRALRSMTYNESNPPRILRSAPQLSLAQ